jgi:hypothetical protein
MRLAAEPSFEYYCSSLTSNGETMYAAIKVFPDIARSKLSVAKNFVGFCLSFMGKLGVDRARVDEQRSFGQRKIFLDGEFDF